MATEAENLGQGIVTVSDPLEEFSMAQVTKREENEAQGAVESFPVLTKSLPGLGRGIDTPPTRLPPELGTLVRNPFSPTTPAPFNADTFSTHDPWLHRGNPVTNPIDFESVPEEFRETSETTTHKGTDSGSETNQTPQYVTTEHDHDENHSGEEDSVVLYKTGGTTSAPKTTMRSRLSTLQYEVLGEVHETTVKNHLESADPSKSQIDEDTDQTSYEIVLLPEATTVTANSFEENETSEPTLDYGVTEDHTDSTFFQNTELPSVDPTTPHDLTESEDTEGTHSTPAGDDQELTDSPDEEEEDQVSVQTAHTTQPSIVEATTLSAPTEASGDGDIEEVTLPGFTTPGEGEEEYESESETETGETGVAASVESAELVTFTPEDVDYHTSDGQTDGTAGEFKID